MGNPVPLKQNAKKSFQGSIVLGKGFILSPEEAGALIAKDPRNKEVLFPYLNGDDLNNDPEQKPSRWVINFFDWSEEKARAYPDCFEIVERLVKPERDVYDENKNSWNKSVKANWWLFGAWRKNLEETISKLDQVMAINRYTKYLMLDWQPNSIVFSDSIVVLALNTYHDFGVLASSIHDIWAWKHSSTMGSSTLRYSASNAFETFPFPLFKSPDIDNVSKQLDELRKCLMKENGIGLTALYNLFHNKMLNASSDIYSSIYALRDLHCKIDNLILSAYEWNDIELKHNFYEIEGLPENDKTRFTINPNARREILRRLLQLNRNIYTKELTAINLPNKKKAKNKNSSLTSDQELF